MPLSFNRLIGSIVSSVPSCHNMIKVSQWAHHNLSPWDDIRITVRFVYSMEHSSMGSVKLSWYIVVSTETSCNFDVIPSFQVLLSCKFCILRPVVPRIVEIKLALLWMTHCRLNVNDLLAGFLLKAPFQSRCKVVSSFTESSLRMTLFL